MLNINSISRFSLFLALLSIQFNIKAATLFVEYDGSVLPNVSSQPFNYNDSRTDTRAIENGILKMSVQEITGSITNVRNDPFFSSDLAIFQFRARIPNAILPIQGLSPGGVIQLRWGNGGKDSGNLLLFLRNGELMLRAGSSPDRTDIVSPFDTSDFHTYTIFKNRRENIQVYANTDLIFDIPYELAARTFDLSGWQSFSNNPLSSSEWDFFNYSIGDDALSFISLPQPVPIPAAIWLFGSALIGLVFKSRKLH